MAEPQEEVLRTFITQDGSKFRYRLVRTASDRVFVREIEAPLGFISLGVIGLPLELLGDMTSQGALLLSLAPPDPRKVVHVIHLGIVRIKGFDFKSNVPGQSFVRADNPGTQTLTEEGILLAGGTFTDTFIEFPEALLTGLGEQMQVAIIADGRLSEFRPVINTPFLTDASFVPVPPPPPDPPPDPPDDGKLVLNGTDFLSDEGSPVSIVLSEIVGGGTITIEGRDITLFGDVFTDTQIKVSRKIMDPLSPKITPGTTKVKMFSSGEESNEIVVV